MPIHLRFDRDGAAVESVADSAAEALVLIAVYRSGGISFVSAKLESPEGPVEIFDPVEIEALAGAGGPQADPG